MDTFLSVVSIIVVMAMVVCIIWIVLNYVVPSMNDYDSTRKERKDFQEKYKDLFNK